MSERRKYIPAEPPEEGRYAIWRRGDELEDWSVARYDEEDGWGHCDCSGAINDVYWFQDVGGINAIRAARGAQ